MKRQKRGGGGGVVIQAGADFRLENGLWSPGGTAGLKVAGLRYLWDSQVELSTRQLNIWVQNREVEAEVMAG